MKPEIKKSLLNVQEKICSFLTFVISASKTPLSSLERFQVENVELYNHFIRMISDHFSAAELQTVLYKEISHNGLAFEFRLLIILVTCFLLQKRNNEALVIFVFFLLLNFRLFYCFIFANISFFIIKFL